MQAILRFVNGLHWPAILFIAVVIMGAPFIPEPHLVEKLRWLSEGHLFRLIDWFDIVWHAWPLLLIVLKLVSHNRSA